jgi:hypothetical protein
MDPIRLIIYHNPYDNIWYSGDSLPSEIKRTRSKSRPTFSINNLTETTPPDKGAIIPVSITQDHRDMNFQPSIHSFLMTTTLNNSQHHNLTLQSYLWSHRFYKRLIGPLSPLQDNGIHIAACIRNGSLLACCDGSYSPLTNLSSHGWVLANQSKVFWNGAGPVDGHKTLTSAYRAELGGFAATLHILVSLCKTHHIQEGAVTVYGDYQRLKDYIKNLTAA